MSTLFSPISAPELYRDRIYAVERVLKIPCISNKCRLSHSSAHLTPPKQPPLPTIVDAVLPQHKRHSRLHILLKDSGSLQQPPQHTYRAPLILGRLRTHHSLHTYDQDRLQGGLSLSIVLFPVLSLFHHINDILLRFDHLSRWKQGSSSRSISQQYRGSTKRDRVLFTDSR